MTTALPLKLVVLRDSFAICRLDPQALLPAWADGLFVTITRTDEELSIVCPQERVPDGGQCERGWRCLRVVGKLDFSLIGIMASLVTPLAEAGIGVFVVSTFDTDYLWTKEVNFGKAIEVLRAAGHTVVQ